MRHLLDVNLLMALAWPNHVHHRAAQAWFQLEHPSWASTPFTKCGFVRLSANPRVIRNAVSPGDAISMLGQMTAAGDHTFLSDTIAGYSAVRWNPPGSPATGR